MRWRDMLINIDGADRKLLSDLSEDPKLAAEVLPEAVHFLLRIVERIVRSAELEEEQAEHGE